MTKSTETGYWNYEESRARQAASEGYAAGYAGRPRDKTTVAGKLLKVWRDAYDQAAALVMGFKPSSDSN